VRRGSIIFATEVQPSADTVAATECNCKSFVFERMWPIAGTGGRRAGAQDAGAVAAPRKREIVNGICP
jgi:hypothetical protein